MIAKKSGSTTTILALSAPYTAYGDTDYTVDAVVSGTSLKLYVNGVLEVSTTDSSYSHGMIGFTATDAIADLGNVLVTTVSASQAQKQNRSAATSVQVNAANSSSTFSQSPAGYSQGSWQNVSASFASFFSLNGHHGPSDPFSL